MSDRCTIGPVKWFASDEYFRTTIWIRFPHHRLVIVLGWDWPRAVWL